MPNKSILMSKTFWGAVVTLVMVLFPSLWTKLGLSADAGVTTDHIVAGLSTALTIYGRFAATSTVSLTGK